MRRGFEASAVFARIGWSAEMKRDYIELALVAGLVLCLLAQGLLTVWLIVEASQRL